MSRQMEGHFGGNVLDGSCKAQGLPAESAAGRNVLRQHGDEMIQPAGSQPFA
ncbi:hypothetical protein RMS29_001340 [Agrobacterium rosae]|uniref:Uncharacterized protein n=1 Tax=Agrobacterium rosae TaxID=1972867 RepID=A0ABU4VXY2_9HYPH|nr:hypothetical protein [Agrobacterium rosae]MCM2434167.1 hypothetical protein [Agrobacterium rosae]MDX8329566.1 hypothetical protein [Agrobacterium rosae]